MWNYFEYNVFLFGYPHSDYCVTITIDGYTLLQIHTYICILISPIDGMPSKPWIMLWGSIKTVPGIFKDFGASSYCRPVISLTETCVSVTKERVEVWSSRCSVLWCCTCDAVLSVVVIFGKHGSVKTIVYPDPNNNQNTQIISYLLVTS